MDTLPAIPKTTGGEYKASCIVSAYNTTSGEAFLYVEFKEKIRQNQLENYMCATMNATEVSFDTFSAKTKNQVSTYDDECAKTLYTFQKKSEEPGWTLVVVGIPSVEPKAPAEPSAAEFLAQEREDLLVQEQVMRDDPEAFQHDGGYCGPILGKQKVADRVGSGQASGSSDGGRNSKRRTHSRSSSPAGKGSKDLDINDLFGFMKGQLDEREKRADEHEKRLEAEYKLKEAEREISTLKAALEARNRELMPSSALHSKDKEELMASHAEELRALREGLERAKEHGDALAGGEEAIEGLKAIHAAELVKKDAVIEELKALHEKKEKEHYARASEAMDALKAMHINDLAEQATGMNALHDDELALQIRDSQTGIEAIRERHKKELDAKDLEMAEGLAVRDAELARAHAAELGKNDADAKAANDELNAIHAGELAKKEQEHCARTLGAMDAFKAIYMDDIGRKAAEMKELQAKCTGMAAALTVRDAMLEEKDMHLTRLATEVRDLTLSNGAIRAELRRLHEAAAMNRDLDVGLIHERELDRRQSILLQRDKTLAKRALELESKEKQLAGDISEERRVGSISFAHTGGKFDPVAFNRHIFGSLNVTISSAEGGRLDGIHYVSVKFFSSMRMLSHVEQTLLEYFDRAGDSGVFGRLIVPKRNTAVCDAIAISGERWSWKE